MLEGDDLATVPVHRRQFGYMFQDFALFPHKSVADNIAFGLRMLNMPPAESDARVEEMLRLVGLQGYGSRSVFELSGGERQRVALARSLAPNPRLLMLDEPLGSLDRALRESLAVDLRNILTQLGVTAIYVTHDQEEAFTVGDRIAIMLAGNIAQDGPPEVVYKRPTDARVARFLGFASLLPIRRTTYDAQLLHTPLGDIPQDTLADKVGADGGLLLIRPDSARAATPPQQSSVAYPFLTLEEETAGGRLMLVGYLDRSSFRGSQYRLTVRVPAQKSDVRLDFDLPAYQSDLATGRLRPLPIPLLGDPIRLAIYPELTTVLPAEEFSGGSIATEQE